MSGEETPRGGSILPLGGLVRARVDTHTHTPLTHVHTLLPIPSSLLRDLIISRTAPNGLLPFPMGDIPKLCPSAPSRGDSFLSADLVQDVHPYSAYSNRIL